MSDGDDKDWSFDHFSKSSEEREENEQLVVSLDGFEGPLDLLLALARQHKIDLTKISISALAEQYIDFIEQMKKQRLEVAADYLVMAAWLAFIKSKLLLPNDKINEDEPTGEELARQLAFRLKRLDAMRQHGELIMARSQLGQDFFACGAPQGFPNIYKRTIKAEAYDLFKAYAQQRERFIDQRLKVKKREVWSIKKARSLLSGLLGISVEWAPIDRLIKTFLESDAASKTAVASTFGASLEMARDGEIELKQNEHFAPIFVKTLNSGGDVPPGEEERMKNKGGGDE